MKTNSNSERGRRFGRPLLLGAGGVAIATVVAVVVATGADYTDRGQFNYRVTAAGSPTPTPTPTETSSPPPAPGLGTGVPTQNFSNVQSLARSGSTLYGWAGPVTSGAGYGAADNVAQPVKVPAGTTLSEIAAGPSHNLAIDQNGDIWGWGFNNDGALAGAASLQFTPVKITSGTTKFRKVAAGGYVNLNTGGNTSTSFAIDTGGNLWSWGRWNGGASTTWTVLGDGARASRSTPRQITTGIDFVDVAAGWEKHAAVTRGGQVYTWGNGQYASLALSDTYSTANVQTPTASPFLSGIVKVAFGGRTAYALDREGYVWVWGNKSATMGASTLGIGTTNPAVSLLCKTPPGGEDGTARTSVCKPLRVPRVSGQSAVIDISAGESNIYALDDKGAVWAWGGNRFGNTGNDTIGTIANQDTLSPTRTTFQPGITIAGVVAEYFGGVAVDTNGGIWAWGRVGLNDLNLLGDGRTTAWGPLTNQPVPKKVK
ncbi:RCC1 domain-containing protein [Leifsonia aquatica]|uniref:RCC1 domain-containing protein n=1 Tax=Leifsonia aquatica TaxID=144185 RepID=UPI00384ED04B